MSEYIAKLTPNEVNLGTEGGLDILVNGFSIQRTLNGMMLVDGEGNRKVVGNLKDGDSFDDVVAVVDPETVPITPTPTPTATATPEPTATPTRTPTPTPTATSTP
jgi:hypothetical protein